jgi:hypothetical protein
MGRLYGRALRSLIGLVAERLEKGKAGDGMKTHVGHEPCEKCDSEKKMTTKISECLITQR